MGYHSRRGISNRFPDTKEKNNFSNLFKFSDFLPAIIHELRNPLNAILSFSELLKFEIERSRTRQTSFSVKENELANYNDYASEISTAATELNELINDLLDVSAINSGNFSVDVSKKINLADVIRRSIRLNYDYASMRNIVIKQHIDENLGLLNLDAKRMKQIITNLISNAIKYSPEKTEIKISASKKIRSAKSVNSVRESSEEYVEISVCDQGFGMTEAQIQTAFIKYKTIPNPNSGKVDSFGLGLPITKQLVEAQNGKILVKSQVGKGSEFILHFPYLM